MRVGIGQFAATADKAANLAALQALIDSAADAGAELVVLPETSIFLDMSATSLAEIAEPLDGPFVSGIAERAAQRSVTVVVGTYEVNPTGGLPFNTTVALGPTGELIGRYRKIHLYDAFGFTESETITPGEFVEPLVLDFGALRLGVFTCYDLRFPEAARRVVDAGVHGFIMPACWAAGPAKEYHWSTLIRARAIENTSYLIAANQTGPVATGFSLIVDPLGIAIATGTEAPGIVVGELDPARVAEVRLRVPSLANRRLKVVPR